MQQKMRTMNTKKKRDLRGRGEGGQVRGALPCEGCEGCL